MRVIIVLGIILIVLGVIALVHHEIVYSTHEEVINIGPIQASSTSSKKIPISPLAGSLVVAGGVALVIVGIRKSKAEGGKPHVGE